MTHFTKIFLLLNLCIFPFFVNAQWEEVETGIIMAESKAAASSDKIFFPGGFDDFNSGSFDKATVAVYDIPSDTWTDTLPLAIGRFDISSAISDNKLFCAGGLKFGPAGFIQIDEVEIIDINTLQVLDTAFLSIPRQRISVVAVGTKVLFAGGMQTNLNINTGATTIETFSRVDIYDTLSDTWSIAELSDDRGGMACAVWGNKAYFAGGSKGEFNMSKVVDIYDADTDTWSTDELSESRAFFGKGVAFAGKVYFAGGLTLDGTPSATIDIYDTENDTWSLAELSEPRAFIEAVATENNILFAGGHNGRFYGVYLPTMSYFVDRYYPATDTWYVDTLPEGRAYFSTVSTEQQAFMVGGNSNNEEGEFEFSTSMLVFNDIVLSSQENPVLHNSIRAYPNPISDWLTIENDFGEAFQFIITDILGKELLKGNADTPSTQINLSNLPAGTYVLTTSSVDGDLHSSQIITKMRE